MRCGIDIGGTTVKIGLVDNYEIKETIVIETKPETLFDDIFSKINEYKDKIDFIGFGIPGNVKNNYINRMPNIGLSDIDLNLLKKKYNISCDIKSSNDANCAALGEALFDNNNDSSYFITLGTGVGGGYVLDGKVIDGHHVACGEIGHIRIDEKHQYKCTCGLFGCLETVASATGIVRLFNEYYKDYNTNIPCDNVSAKVIFDYAKAGDELGLKVLEEVSEYLGKALAILAVTNDVKTFYIGGGVAECGEFLINKIKNYYLKYSFYACKNTEIKLAKLGNKAGMIGAAYL